MKDFGRMCWLGLGLAVGIAATIYFRAEPQPVWAGNDRHDDYIMTTGPVMAAGNIASDGIWLLDYRAGKLLGTIVDRNLGKIVGWAEVDLVKEFNIPPKQNVHFMMTTGSPIGANNAGLIMAPIPQGSPPVPNNPGPPAGPPAGPGGNPVGGPPRGHAGGFGGGQAGGFGGGIGAVNGGANASGNAALYLTEVNTGRFGVYTMAPAMDGTNRMVIRRHDGTLFRQPAPQ